MMLIETKKAEEMTTEELKLVTYRGKTIHDMSHTELIGFIQYVSSEYLSITGNTIYQVIRNTFTIG